MKSFVDSSPHVGDIKELANILDEYGYLYLKNFVPKEPLLTLQKEVLTLLKGAGWSDCDVWDKHTANMEAVCKPPEKNYRQVHDKLWSLESFHKIPHLEPLVALMKGVLGDDVLVHPRKILRVTFPRPEIGGAPTKPHQDFPEIQGSPDTYTIWFPLHDCAEDEGGLAVAPYTHKNGVAPIQLSDGLSGIEVATSPNEWHSGKISLGDVLIFHSYTIHSGLSNTGDKFRLSIDARYQRAKDPICLSCLELIDGDFNWDVVYRDWSSSENQFYWKKMNPTIIPFDTRFEMERDDLALAAAAKGDRKSIRVLQYVSAYNPDLTKRNLAQEYLHKFSAPIYSDLPKETVSEWRKIYIQK